MAPVKNKSLGGFVVDASQDRTVFRPPDGPATLLPFIRFGLIFAGPLVALFLLALVCYFKVSFGAAVTVIACYAVINFACRGLKPNAWFDDLLGGSPSLFAAMRWLSMDIVREGPPFDEVLGANTPIIYAFTPHGIIGWNRLPLMVECSRRLWQRIVRGSVSRPVAWLAASVVLYIPGVAEAFRMCGVVSAEKPSALKALRTGHDVAVVPGGIPEQVRTLPDVVPPCDVLCLKNRKGFIRLALETGAGVAPVLAIGESDLHGMLPFPSRSVRTKLAKLLRVSFAVPTITVFGIAIPWVLPRRRRLRTVVGQPLRIPKCTPTKQLVDEWHARFLEYVAELHAQHAKAVTPEGRKLIVE